MIDSHHVSTTLNYWDEAADNGKPTPVVIGGGAINNKRPFRAHPFVITDVTGDQDKYTLDRHGFQYVHHASQLGFPDFSDDRAILTAYRAECASLVRSVAGASRVHVFDHKVRRGPTDWHGLGNKATANRGPLSRCHVDQSYRGAELRLQHEFPDDLATTPRRRRWAIVNVWRPLATVYKDPLAVADAGSVADADLAAAPLAEEGFMGESWAMRHSAAHRYFFKHAMTPADVLLIKCFDSEVAVARRAPHTAFEDAAYCGHPSRQSIEVRCLVFWD